MSPEEAIQEARGGAMRPVYLVVGEEGYRVAEVVAALEAAVDTGPARGFNDDRFMAGETSAGTVLSAARTVPMMARQRLVLVRGLERWDGKGGKSSEGALDELAQYAADPVPSTLMVLVATKLNANRKLMRAAKKQGFLVSCAPLARRDLPRWIQQRAGELGHRLEPGVADALAELVGPELGPVADALDRLSLYVGSGVAIDHDALAAVVTRVRQETVWALVDALSARDLRRSLAALHDAYNARDSGLPLLGLIGSQVRKLSKLEALLARGTNPSDAAQRAGFPPFKARDMARAVRGLGGPTLERWLMLIAEADLALKGSRRPGSEVLGTMLIDMCR